MMGLSETHPLSPGDINIFSPKIGNFSYIKNCRQKIAFWEIFYNSFDFYWVFINCCNQRDYKYQQNWLLQFFLN